MSALASAGGAPVRATFLPYALPCIGREEEQEVLAALASGWITTGPRVKRLEEKLAAYVGAPNAICVDSCTAALHLSLVALDLTPGDEVITSPLTFCSTANTIVHAGGRVVLADVEPDTLNLSPAAVERSITPKTKAIVAVHYGGQACEMEALLALAQTHGLRVIEDAAHAIGAEHRGRRIGTLSTATCFSFYATKNMTTAEGGAITLADDQMASRLRVLSLHGMSKDAWKRYTSAGSWYYEVVAPGFKYNMTDIEAALGLHQVDRLEGFIATRRRYAAVYDAAIDALGGLVERFEPRPHNRHVYHLYPILLNLDALTIDRARFIDELKAENIGTTVNFIPIHYHPYYRDTLPYRQGSFPVAESAYERLISLPLYPRMTDEDLAQVMEAVAKVARAHRR
ncbi:MAG TPA: DegT/DnrJ/EryC1/StrS aminotransferase family protein [Thermoanaerobaculia bacterium]|nr:DegT/DnrJ/EryC1/StrS aminotransferase family protein [Thermoanaerobaculia bacterium]HXT52587.1 DegT/DnrJ/EryC1/StrS aminotransferase family protein [Thermoanaerobaculia bacterium]